MPEYYLQDDLGSPIRLLNENGELTESYGYDEFGRDLYGNQGEAQPFGYTGYQYDRVSNTYFAQAREYVSHTGRFAGQDVIKGFTEIPYSLNAYLYCWGNPLVWVDLNGLIPEIIWKIPKELLEGKEAHLLLQEKFLAEYEGKGGYAEFYIESGIARNPSDTGKADIVYMNAAIQTAEVYEIKPGSYSPGGKNHDIGYSQMMGYVDALQQSIRLPERWMSAPGYTLNAYFSGKVIESELYKGEKEIVYRVYENGMIIYYYRNRQEEREPATAPVLVGEKEPEKNWGKLFTPKGILTLGVVVSLFWGNLAENVFTGGVGVADDVLCYSAMATMILSVVEAEEVHKIEDCEEMS